MSTFLCFICHSTVNAEINEETRDKYREVVGINLCPDSQLCYICCHMLNKLSLFKSVCLKRSVEYPVLFSEKGTINLQKSDTDIHTVCPDKCEMLQQQNIRYFQFIHNNYNNSYVCDKHIKMEANDFNDYLNQYRVDNTETNDNEFDNRDSFVANEMAAQKDGHILNENRPNHNFSHCNLRYDFNMNDIIEDATKMYNDASKKIENVMENIDSVIENIGKIIISRDNANKKKDTVIENNDTVMENNDTVMENNDTAIESNDTVIENNDTVIENNVKQDNKKIIKETFDINAYTIPKKNTKAKKNALKKIILSLEDQKAELEKKRKEKQYVEAEHKCYNCALGFLFKDTYQAHMMRHEESNGQYSCPLCTIRVSSLTLLKAHTARHAERCVCSKCGVRVTGRHHTCKQTLTRTLPCNMCESLFTDASGLQQHIKRVHTSKTSGRLHTCSVCGESSKTQGALRTHMLKHIKRKFKCEQCPATYSSPYTLNQHVKKHTSVTEAFYCVTCKTSFTTKKYLQAHQRNTLNHQPTVFECPICKKMCPSQRALASHIETVHSATKEHKCTECPARYTSRKSLVRHVRTHTTETPVEKAVCHWCGSTFKGNNKLNRHLREVCQKTEHEEQMSNY